jgi:hypothetical protein
MPNRAVWLMTALLIGLAVSAPSRAQQLQNQIVSNFETGVVTPWTTPGSGASAWKW